MKKSAIIFGINDYPNCPLRNANNDASALTEKLVELGFEAKCFLDVNTETMDREVYAFKKDLEQSSVGLFFFAGHGIQCKGENYLASVSTSFVDESSCKYTALPLNMVIDTFEESKVNTKIIILDACRDNPFITWRSTANEGLAPVYAPKGTIIAFSTSPGQRASDGANNHGIYTNALLTHIGTKKLPIEDMFKRVRNTVSSQTNHRQITWEHTSLMGTFYFNSGYDEDRISALYSKDALSDRDYDFESDEDIAGIVNELKTYNWYRQNPAISRIDRIDLSLADKDDLFVLGRNIYQAACGGSGNAENWIDDIESNLNHMHDNIAMHLLNGILFEIYFDSRSELRSHPKIDHFEKPVRLCQKERYSICSMFVRSYLEQYPQRIIYIPGTPTALTIDILISQNSNRWHIDGIYIDGLSCMYDKDSSELYEYDDSMPYYREMSKSELEESIIEKVVVPQNRVRFTYNSELTGLDKVLTPPDYQLLRYVL